MRTESIKIYKRHLNQYKSRLLVIKNWCGRCNVRVKSHIPVFLRQKIQDESVYLTINEMGLLT